MTKDEALKLALEYIETNAHERRHVRWAIKEALAQPDERQWVDLTDTQIENIYNEVVKIHRGAAMPYGQVVFGRAVQAKLRELNAPQIDPNKWAFDNGLEST
jgi:hypothetical protein